MSMSNRFLLPAERMVGLNHRQTAGLIFLFSTYVMSGLQERACRPLVT